MPRIFYLAPDFDIPSWGVGLLYHHVRVLLDSGFDACVLHQQEPFRLSWLGIDVPVRYLNAATFDLDPDDVLVVPEVLARSGSVGGMTCRRIVFVQNGFVIFAGSSSAFRYRDVGFESAMVTMPHLAEIVGAHCGLTPAVIPPFIAPYFFVDPEHLRSPRRREVLIFKKAQYGQAGYPDFDLVVKLLERHFEEQASRGGEERWRIVVLEGRTHQQTALAMKRSALFVNLNTLEGFNVSVAEAMAAGSVSVCYDAYGGRDYVRDRYNAFVFPNNYVFPLVDAVIDLTETWDSRTEELGAVRERAHATAREFDEKRMAAALGDFFASLLSGERG